MVMTLKIGSEQSVIVPIADEVLCKLTNIQPNKFNPDTVLDFGFTIIDFDYEDDDEQIEAVIRDLADKEHIHWERYNLPAAGQDLGKGMKLYKHLKGMKGGKDIEQGEEVDLGELQAKNYRIDFEHVDKKSGNPQSGFTTVMDDRGNAVQKAQIAKIRPEKRKRREETAVAAPARKAEPVQAAIPANDDDLFPDDDTEE